MRRVVLLRTEPTRDRCTARTARQASSGGRMQSGFSQTVESARPGQTRPLSGTTSTGAPTGSVRVRPIAERGAAHRGHRRQHSTGRAGSGVPARCGPSGPRPVRPAATPARTCRARRRPRAGSRARRVAGEHPPKSVTARSSGPGGPRPRTLAACAHGRGASDAAPPSRSSRCRRAARRRRPGAHPRPPCCRAPGQTREPGGCEDQHRGQRLASPSRTPSSRPTAGSGPGRPRSRPTAVAAARGHRRRPARHQPPPGRR